MASGDALLKSTVLGIIYIYWGFMGIMENKMETTIAYRSVNSESAFSLSFPLLSRFRARFLTPK